MKFDGLKEFTNYIDLMGQHLLKVSENKKTNFVFNEKTYKNRNYSAHSGGKIKTAIKAGFLLTTKVSEALFC